MPSAPPLYYAHSTPGPEDTWERLTDHLRQTADRAGAWAAAEDAATDGCTALAGWASPPHRGLN